VVQTDLAEKKKKRKRKRKSFVVMRKKQMFSRKTWAADCCA
jgi:hypothetical protein